MSPLTMGALHMWFFIQTSLTSSFILFIPMYFTFQFQLHFCGKVYLELLPLVKYLCYLLL